MKVQELFLLIILVVHKLSCGRLELHECHWMNSNLHSGNAPAGDKDFISGYFFQIIGTHLILSTSQKNHLPGYQPLHALHAGLHRGHL